MNAINDPLLARRPDPGSPASYPAPGPAIDAPGPVEPKGVEAGETRDETMPEHGEAVEHTLRRTGRKPVRFKGHQIIDATGQVGRSNMRYDINLYRSVAGRIVVEATARREALGDPDLFRVKTFDTLPMAACWLESYRCIDDIPVPPGLCAVDTALPWMVLQAVQLRQQIERIEADYHALISEIFIALELTDPDDVDDAQVGDCGRVRSRPR